MKKIKHALALGALALMLNACSDDDTNKKETKPDGGAVGTCLQQDSNACAVANSTCTAQCVADEACQKECMNTFCGCMNTAGCGAPAECKSSTTHDGGIQPDPDQGSQPDPDQGSQPDPDQGTPEECLQEDINSCALGKSTCVTACIADEECLDDCQEDFCDCMDLAECDPPAECMI